MSIYRELNELKNNMNNLIFSRSKRLLISATGDKDMWHSEFIFPKEQIMT